MGSYDLQPVPESGRTAGILDVALIFAGANVVTSTLITGGTLGLLGGGTGRLALLAVVGILVGTAPIAWLARLGPRTGLPSMVLLRRPFGTSGAAAVSLLLVVTNFAWIALNNVVAAQAVAGILAGPEWGWSLAVGIVATLLALGGQRTMALFDRVAVPLLAVLGALLTWRLLTAPAPLRADLATAGAPVLVALDLIVGYQISWSLMFADYTRFQRREAQASLSVLLGLSVTSLWLMIVGAAAAQRGGGNDPTSMVLGLGLPATALVLVALSTVTTNFVNLYLSALAVRNVAPAARPTPTVLVIGAVGTGLGLASGGFLARYADFMGALATLLLPIVAIALVHFFVPRGSGPGDRDGEPARWSPTALAAWALGVATYQVCSRGADWGLEWPVLDGGAGATLPTLVAAGSAYAAARRWTGRRT